METIDINEEAQILSKASVVAEANSSVTTENAPLMRPSNAGYPIFQQVWRLFVEPAFPSIVSSTDPAKRIKRIMNICSGHVFERAVEQLLLSTYPDHDVVQQQKLTYKHFSGSADFVLLNKDKGSLVIVECKSIGKPTKREIVSEKLLTDHWGYKTQLSIYTEAAVDTMTNDGIRLTSVTPLWYVWSRPSEKLFVVDASRGQTKVDTVLCAENAVGVYERLLVAKEAFNNGDLQTVAQIAVEELPFDKEYVNGYSRGCTPFHFSPFTEVFYDEEGYTKEASACSDILIEFLQIAKQNKPELFTELAKEIS